MKTDEQQLLVEYETKLNAYQNKLDAMYGEIPLSKADCDEWYRLINIVNSLKQELKIRGDE